MDLGKLSAWVAMVIIAREFAVSGLRMVAAAEGVVIPASRWGKAKTAGQMVAILVVILEPRWQLWGHAIGTYLLGVAVVLTLVSGIDYFVKARLRLKGTPPVSLQGDAPIDLQGTEGGGKPSARRGLGKE